MGSCSSQATAEGVDVETQVFHPGLHHVEVYVSNLDKSVRVWGWLLTRLGFELYQTWEGGVSYRPTSGSGSYLCFVQASKPELKYHRCAPGLNHLAFRVRTKEEVDMLREELKAHELSLLYDQEYPNAGGPGHYAVYFEGPDRIKIEVVASGEY